jgi:hypothetical protein
MLTPPVALVQTLREPRRGPTRENTSPPPFTEQLRMRLQQVPEPPTPRRNPFVFGARQRRVPILGSPVEASASIVEPAPVAPVGPMYELSGIGVTGDVRTAILSDGKAVVLAKVGTVVGGYQVAEISDDSVTLVADSGARHILRLR